MSKASLAVAALGLMILGAGAATGQPYPNKPVRLITSAAGSGSDHVTRIIAQGISAPLGQPIVVDNRGSLLAAEIVFKAPADGYTLLVTGAPLWIGPLLRDSSPYDPQGFAPVTLVSRTPNVLVVTPSLPVNSVKELIAFAKSKPGVLNYSSGGTGSSTHLAVELFKSLAGVNIVRIPYKSSASEITDLVSGRVQLTVGTSGELMPHVKLGKLRALAVSSSEPSVLYPGVPTIAASGVPGYELVATVGAFAPVKTPANIVNRLSQEMARLIKTAEANERFLSAGLEPVGSTPDVLAAVVKADVARLGKVIKDAGIRAD